MQKFYKKRRNFFRTLSQPVSPTDSESRSVATAVQKGFFSRRHSKGSVGSSSRSEFLSRTQSKEGDSLSTASSLQGGLFSRRQSKDSDTSNTIIGGYLNRRPSKEIEMADSATSSIGNIFNKRMSKDGKSLKSFQIQDNTHIVSPNFVEDKNMKNQNPSDV